MRRRQRQPTSFRILRIVVANDGAKICSLSYGNRSKIPRMATVKKGILTSSGEWWIHLRWTKRAFWKAERRAAGLETVKEVEAIPDEPEDDSKLGGVWEALRRSPLVGADIDFTRDAAHDRKVDI